MGVPRASMRPTATRVQESTAPEVNARIQRDTQAQIARAAVNPQEIERRLAELNREWEIERALQTNFAVVNLVSILLGALVARPWFMLTGIAAGFMAEHALKGWCPPLSALRRLRIRTAKEIEQERYALKALRGDFRDVTSDEPRKAFDAAAT